MIRKPLLRIGACALAVTCGSAFMPGCSAPSYVNIPGQASDVARNNPNAGDVITIMSKAIAAAVEAEGLDGAYEVLLPEGSNQQTYQEVVLQVGGGAITPDTLRESPVPSVAVAGVRVRNRNAEVDIVRPSPTGRAAVEVQLFWYYGDAWQVERVRPLRLSVEALGWEVPTEGAPRPVPPGVVIPETTPEPAASEPETVPPTDAEPDA
ncbi:MAG: hypothetical protein AAGF84_11100 [Planctomycetota bacterium]